MMWIVLWVIGLIFMVCGFLVEKKDRKTASEYYLLASIIFVVNIIAMYTFR